MVKKCKEKKKKDEKKKYKKKKDERQIDMVIEFLEKIIIELDQESKNRLRVRE